MNGRGARGSHPTHIPVTGVPVRRRWEKLTPKCSRRRWPVGRWEVRRLLAYNKASAVASSSDPNFNYLGEFRFPAPPLRLTSPPKAK
ncbi:hypothetical protein GUJ93_ZPchr0001g32290 [Zizania palustris]|uniref:Uncharacterized protein n=1 Tax=Zizania palustris TaxID=103762 RepID=A0A8J5RVF6_ZIZPA|nr:hypothetical protein GUJ93_ZPchr0001g32290 [Zizania palustris]